MSNDQNQRQINSRLARVINDFNALEWWRENQSVYESEKDKIIITKK